MQTRNRDFFDDEFDIWHNLSNRKCDFGNIALSTVIYRCCFTNRLILKITRVAYLCATNFFIALVAVGLQRSIDTYFKLRGQPENIESDTVISDGACRCLITECGICKFSLACQRMVGCSRNSVDTACRQRSAIY